jgi:plasmid stabilization system protein ParE
MANYQLTTLAREDLRAVARYTVLRWGIAQARRYQAALENCFQSIGEKKCPLILAVFHEKMDLMMRIQTRLKD